MCRIGIAVERNFAKQGQEKQTDFFDITCWGQQAEFVCKYFNKGRMIHIEGRIQNDNYTDQNGVKQYRTSIIADRIDFCGDKRNDGSGYNNSGNFGGGQPYGAPQQNYGGNGGYNNNYGGQSYGNPQYNQPAPTPAPAPAPQAAPNQAPQPIELGDLGDFEEILSDGEVPF
jgi:single-strand DNA-binding protein